MEIDDISYLTKGKRGLIYTAFLNGKKIVVKKKNPKSEAVGNIEREGNILKLLNKHCIGPKLIKAEKDSFMYYFIEGDFIIDFFENNEKKAIKKVIKDIFEQLFVLDKLKLNKEEMHHPIKHIVVTKKLKPVLLDFERCKKTQKPKNVTQFCQFLISEKTRKLLNKKGFKIKKREIIKLARNYKHNEAKKELIKIEKALFS